MTDQNKDPGGGSPVLAITLIAIALAAMILAGLGRRRNASDQEPVFRLSGEDTQSASRRERWGVPDPVLGSSWTRRSPPVT
jgi:hypothetical protein